MHLQLPSWTFVSFVVLTTHIICQRDRDQHSNRKTKLAMLVRMKYEKSVIVIF